MLSRIDLPVPPVMHLISSLRVGGAERLLVSSMRAAAEEGDARFVAVVMNDEVDPGLWAELTGTGLPVYRLDRREGHLHPRYLKEILSIARRHGVRVIHTHNEGSRFWAMLARALMPSLRVVYTVHAQGNAASITGLSRLAYQHLVDATVSISSFVSGECHVLKPRRLVQIENGTELSRFRVARPERPDGAPLRLVQVARFARFKGQDILVEAVRLLREHGIDVTCTLVGVAADPAYLDEVRAQIAAHGLEDRIRIELNRTDVENILKESDVFVLPSREEGFGIVLIEAMAAGLPIVAAKIGGAAELIRDGLNGFHAEPENARDFARLICTLALDEPLRTGMARDALRSSLHYDIKGTLASHKRLYSELALA